MIPVPVPVAPCSSFIIISRRSCIIIFYLVPTALWVVVARKFARTSQSS